MFNELGASQSRTDTNLDFTASLSIYEHLTISQPATCIASDRDPQPVYPLAIRTSSASNHPDEKPSSPNRPTMPKITTDQDLIDFRKSSGYLDFISWIQNRSESIRGKKIETSVEGCSEVCILLS